MKENVLTLTREDVREEMEGLLGRDPSEEEVDEACHWIIKDFDWGCVYERVDNILHFRMNL